MPGIRPDARCVLKARLLSQTLANTEVADRHTSTSMQDCWSQCRTLHSHVRDWYQIDQQVRICRTNRYYLLISLQRICLCRLSSKSYKIHVSTTSKPLSQLSKPQLFSTRISMLLFLLYCISTRLGKGLSTLSYKTYLRGDLCL